ncbi:hypothetical protein HPB47_000725 [Ixodes persulcatus]|uniref:Uncharacterized protein n=1 Tax=Ixodes persulcatus TaxID=34615 RepID=A0AC60PR57_IXOPE|nr:hypothetical protein HPB47_000725 [Ixodes persulcatus]
MRLLKLTKVYDRPDEVYDERPLSLDKAKDLIPSPSETTAYKKRLTAETQGHTRAYREGESRAPLLCDVFESEEVAAVCGDGNFGCEKEAAPRGPADTLSRSVKKNHEGSNAAVFGNHRRMDPFLPLGPAGRGKMMLLLRLFRFGKYLEK